jgi:hypothetical protein
VPHLPQRRRRSAPLAREDGQATVELAFVLPVLLVILLGLLDFGRALNYWNDANQLAGEGARYAAVNRIPAGSATLKGYLAGQAMPELRNGSTNVQPVQVCIELPAGASVGSPVHVSLQSRLSLIPFLGDKLGIGSVAIKGDATNRLEQVPTSIDTGCS